MTQRHLLVIGAQRCGTTYLSQLLDAHPQITMARPGRPEPKVFLSQESTDKGLTWYRDTYFAHATSESLLGEKSTSYIEHPAAAVRARQVLGEAEVVVLLRDPVERAVSNWRFSTDNGFEQRPLEEALLQNLTSGTAWDEQRTSVSPFAYLERGRYADYLPPWSAAFPSSTHVLFLDELRTDDAAVGAMYADLGVDAGFRPPGRDQRVNQSQEPAPDLPRDLVGRLRDYFAASDAALSRLLGRDLPWRTDPQRGEAHA